MMFTSWLNSFLFSIESFLSGILLLISLLSAFMASRKQPKRKFFIVFALWCLFSFIHTYLTGTTEILFSLFPEWLIIMSASFSYAIIMALLPLLIYTYFPLLFRLKTALLIMVPCVALLIFSFWTPQFMEWIESSYFAITLLVIYQFSRTKSIKNKRSHKLLKILIIPLFFLLIIQIFLFLSKISPVYILPIALAYSALYFSLDLIKKFPLTFHGHFYQINQKLQNDKIALETELLRVQKKLQEWKERQARFQNQKSDYLTHLTNREKEIFELLLGSDTYQEMADRLFISQRTINIHIQSIYRKLEVKSRTELMTLFQNYLKK